MRMLTGWVGPYPESTMEHSSRVIPGTACWEPDGLVDAFPPMAASSSATCRSRHANDGCWALRGPIVAAVSTAKPALIRRKQANDAEAIRCILSTSESRQMTPVARSGVRWDGTFSGQRPNYVYADPHKNRIAQFLSA